MPRLASPCLTLPHLASFSLAADRARDNAGRNRKSKKGPKRARGRQAGRQAGRWGTQLQRHAISHKRSSGEFHQSDPCFPRPDLRLGLQVLAVSLAALCLFSRDALHCTLSCLSLSPCCTLYTQTHTQTRSCGLWFLDACLSLSSLLDAAALNLWLVPNKLESAPFSLGSRNAGQRRVTVPP